MASDIIIIFLLLLVFKYSIFPPQSSLAKRFKCGCIFNDDFIATLLPSVQVKEF